jgi:hypothetical protein
VTRPETGTMLLPQPTIQKSKTRTINRACMEKLLTNR